MDRRAVWAGLLAAVVIACGDAAGEMTGNAFIETGDMLRDAGMEMIGDAAIEAGQALGDGGEQGDASAQPVVPATLEADCEIEAGVQKEEENGDYRIETKLYAELDVSAYAALDLAGAAFVLCELDEEVEMNPPPAECGDDTEVECVGDYPLELPECRIEKNIEIRDGMARVICGEHHEQEVEGVLHSWGHRYESVKLVIR
jgi:hypothetical protein